MNERFDLYDKLQYRGINHSIHAVHVASKAIKLSYHIQSSDRDRIRDNVLVLSHASVCKIEKLQVKITSIVIWLPVQLYKLYEYWFCKVWKIN